MLIVIELGLFHAVYPRKVEGSPCKRYYRWFESIKRLERSMGDVKCALYRNVRLWVKRTAASPFDRQRAPVLQAPRCDTGRTVAAV